MRSVRMLMSVALACTIVMNMPFVITPMALIRVNVNKVISVTARRVAFERVIITASMAIALARHSTNATAIWAGRERIARLIVAVTTIQRVAQAWVDATNVRIGRRVNFVNHANQEAMETQQPGRGVDDVTVTTTVMKLVECVMSAQENVFVKITLKDRTAKVVNPSSMEILDTEGNVSINVSLEAC